MKMFFWLAMFLIWVSGAVRIVPAVWAVDQGDGFVVGCAFAVTSLGCLGKSIDGVLERLA